MDLGKLVKVVLLVVAGLVLLGVGAGATVVLIFAGLSLYLSV